MKAKPKGTKIDQLKAERQMTDRERLWRERVAHVEQDNRKLRTLLADRQDFARECAAATVSADPLPVPRLRVSRVRPTVYPALKLSDWHIGECVNAREVEGFNRFNWAIAQERIWAIVGSFLSYLEHHRQIYNIPQVTILGEGDYVSGDIHQELLVTNEFPLPVQTAKAGLLLGEVIRKIAGSVPRVHVSLVAADNHGRLQKKPQAKQKSSNNMSYIVNEFARAMNERTRNVTFQVAEGAKQVVTIGGYKFLSEHGDAVRGWAGHPYYGFSRLIGKEATRRMNTDKGFHYWSIGHWHVPGFIEGRTVVNGSLSATSEFDHLNGRHADPAQVAFLVGRHGLFNLIAFQGLEKDVIAS